MNPNLNSAKISTMPTGTENSTETNPLVEHAQQFGFIDNFAPIEEATSNEALKRVLLGSISGGLASQVDNRQPNALATTATTGLGAGLGFLGGAAGANLAGLASPERESAQLLGSLLGGGAGYYFSSKIPRRKKIELSVPGLQLKQASWLDSLKEGLRQAREQLPALRTADSLAGAGAGAATGWLVNRMRNQDGLTESQRELRRNKAMLTGAGVGLLGGNLIGDRTRRYISNTSSPFGYETPNLKPQSLKHLWTAAVLDKPYQHMLTGRPDSDKHRWLKDPASSSPELNPTGKGMVRRELFRRALGVHSDNPSADIWAKNQDGSVSLNPAHKSISELLNTHLGTKGMLPQVSTDPLGFISRINSDHQFRDVNEVGFFAPEGHFMADITGGQRINTMVSAGDAPAAPSEMLQGHNPPVSDIIATVRDRWGVAPRKADSDYLKTSPGQIMRGGNTWLNEPAPKGSSGSTYIGGNEQPTNKNMLRSLLLREAAEKVLFNKPPWVSQKLHFRYNPDEGRYAMKPFTGDGRGYPAD